MSELVITPNFEKKSARFKGTVAAGEHASVRIVGAGTLTRTTLRLRAVLLNDTLAVFPLVTTGATPDAWAVDGDDLTCTINLNTAQMQKQLRRVFEKEMLFVLDDTTNHTLYFSDLCIVRGWPQEEGCDTPVDLDGYSDFVADTKSRLTAAEIAIETNTAAIYAETTARQAADSQHTAAILATKDELAAETAAREAADEALSDADDAHDEAIEELAGGIETAESHITNHALDNTRHLTADKTRELIAETLAAKNYNLETQDGLIDAIINIIETLGGTASE